MKLLKNRYFTPIYERAEMEGVLQLYKSLISLNLEKSKKI